MKVQSIASRLCGLSVLLQSGSGCCHRSVHNTFSRELSSSPFGAVNVFDRNAKRRQKDRASMAADPSVYDYIRDTIAGYIVDRVYDVSRYGIVNGIGTGTNSMVQILIIVL